MTVEVLALRSDNPAVTLTAYLQHDSAEFNTGTLRPALVLAPGGGYLFTSDREAEPVALRFAGEGYQTFVVRYSTASIGDTRWPRPLVDLAKAVQLVRQNSRRWFVDPERVTVCGFSAGGNLVAQLGTRWHEPALGKELAGPAESWRPNGVIAGYPVVDYHVMLDEASLDPAASLEDPASGFSKMKLWRDSNLAVLGTTTPSKEQLDWMSPSRAVSSRTPPTFVWHTAADDLVYVRNAYAFASELARHHVPHEMHVFQTGGHGLSLADVTTASGPDHVNPAAAQWVPLALTWLRTNGL
ncbi:MAG: alpha/beta hydrolase [Spirochaetales bacterium]